jgi:hypothetical protein
MRNGANKSSAASKLESIYWREAVNGFTWLPHSAAAKSRWSPSKGSTASALIRTGCEFANVDTAQTEIHGRSTTDWNPCKADTHPKPILKRDGAVLPLADRFASFCRLKKRLLRPSADNPAADGGISPLGAPASSPGFATAEGSTASSRER